MLSNKRVALFTATRESLCAATKTQWGQLKKKKKVMEWMDEWKQQNIKDKH